MKRFLCRVSSVFCIVMVCWSLNVHAEKRECLEELLQSEEYLIGEMVKSIQLALLHPEAETSLVTLIEYGQDSRYYTMIRGWVSLELSGVVSQYESAHNESARERHARKIEVLEKVIRAIDLE